MVEKSSRVVEHMPRRTVPLWMSIPKDVEKRESKIDEALKETFPASDTPTFVGGVDAKTGQVIVKDERGQEQAADKKPAVRNK